MGQTSIRSAAERAHAKLDINFELKKLEEALAELKVQYEQYFSGVLQLTPDKLHADVKRMLRSLKKAPFRNSAVNYRLKALEGRYNTFNTYWQRVLKEREAGTYCKDVFKANMRERFAQEDARAQTALGAAERGLETLFRAYQTALEKHTGRQANIDFDCFRENLVARSKALQEKNAGKKLSFKVVVRDGRVSVQARVKE